MSQVTPGTLLEVQVDGKPVALCNSGGQIHAIGGECPHRNGPLGHGALHGTAVVCPWHAWEFDCRTGEYDYNPSIRVPVYPVMIEGDDILIEIEAEAAGSARTA